jgi:hypothetical protein
MEPDPHNSAQELRARARAVRTASEQLRAHAHALRASASRLLADTATLRARLDAALQPSTTDDTHPIEPTPERPRVRAPPAAAAPGTADGEASRTTLGPLFEQLAQTLAHSARLAEEHAAREHAAGHPASADQERFAARHARDAAAHSHDLALRHNPTTPAPHPADVTDHDSSSRRADDTAPPPTQ